MFPRRSWKYFQTIIRPWTVRDLWRSGFVQSNVQHVSPASAGFAPKLPPRLCLWTPLGYFRTSIPRNPLLSPRSKFLATPLTVLSVYHFTWQRTIGWWCVGSKMTGSVTARKQTGNYKTKRTKLQPNLQYAGLSTVNPKRSVKREVRWAACDISLSRNVAL